ncbi:MAG TPA: AMMECR1 domain-containing protein [Nitrospinae bacterium]|nr:AMMECR1 domain-containing protein [Nitrospinota bacterium]HBA25967.1 AMMECR1 domain-containing protein [Nitrospinota bacterium]
MNTHPLVKLARDTIDAYVKTGKTISIPSYLTDEMKGMAGVFVSIKKHGDLRGCIGTFSPTQPNIAAEVIQNAISAATRDPRFPPITPEELDSLDISVDILTEPEKIASPDELDPKRYGVIVTKGWKKGLLLPDIEGVDTVEEQIYIAKRKAGISPDEEVKLQRFEVKRYK